MTRPAHRSVTVVAAALALAAPAYGSRAPSVNENRQIRSAVRFFPTIGRQNSLRFTRVRVSTVDVHFAAAQFGVRDQSGALIANLTALLANQHGWRVVFLGDQPPPCAAAPKAVRGDLLGTPACRAAR